MVKHNKLGKVIGQIGGLRIREIQTPLGMEYGLYAGKRLFKKMLNPQTLQVMALKIQTLLLKHKVGVHPPYSSKLWGEYSSFMKKR